jgi:hypothetical protein
LGIKRRRILRRIQKHKLSLVKIIPEKVIHEKDALETLFGAFLGENT